MNRANGVMDQAAAGDLGGRLRQFRRGPRCISRGQPPTDKLMQQWVDGVLSRDPLARKKIAVAIRFSISKVAKADATAQLSGPAQDARHCYAQRVDILDAIQR